MAETSHVYKRAPKVKRRRAQNVHWSTTRNYKILYLGQKNTPVDRPFFPQEEDQGLLFFYFFPKMAAKHLNSKWPPTFQFKMTDSFLFTAILQVS